MTGLDPPEIEENVLVMTLVKQASQKRAGGREDHFVTEHLLVFTGQGDISELYILSQIMKSSTNIF